MNSFTHSKFTGSLVFANKSPWQVMCRVQALWVFIWQVFVKSYFTVHLDNGVLLLLSRFSRVRLCATPWTAAHQAPPSLGFSRQEHWSGLPFSSPVHDSEKWKWSRSVVSDFSDPMDCSLPGSSAHGIFQAKVLEKSGVPLPSPNE